jgi:hypothetical protein
MILRRLLSVAAIAGCMAAPSAQAQVRVQIFPPASFVAVNTPVYYEGHATYWYGNQWYYRDGRQWRAYRQEPVYLHEYRGRQMASRRYYEPSHRGEYREHERFGQGNPHEHEHDRGNQEWNGRGNGPR